jgi:HEAT repeat protein
MPPRSAVLALAGLIAAAGLAGCGKKPPPAAAEATPPDDPTPAVSPAPKPDPGRSKPRATVAEAPPPRRAGTPRPIPAAEPPPVFAIQPPVPQVPPVAPPPSGTPPEPPKPKEFEWPTEVAGKTVKDVIKALSDPDPMVRESALRTLPLFGPPAFKVVDKTKRSVVAQRILEMMQPGAKPKENDPGVRFAAFATAATLGFDRDADTQEAVRILRVAIDASVAGGPTRHHAVQTLAAFGHKAVAAVPTVVGPPAYDSAYETRRSVAATLGRIGFNEFSGPSHPALKCLTEVLFYDPCVAVRAEAMQSVVVLGPPLAPREKDKASIPLRDIKDPRDIPKVDEKAVAEYVLAIKRRIGTAKGSRDLEPDNVVDVWARLALIRLDPRELNDENLTALARHVSGTDAAAKVQALQAFALLGEQSAKKLKDIAGALSDPDPAVVTAAATALASMGPAAAPAIPDLEKVRVRGKEKEEKEYYGKLATEAIKAIQMPRPKK